MKDSKRKSKPSKKSRMPTSIPSNHLDYRASREYYGVVRKGKIEEFEPGNPIVYKLDEIEFLRRDYPRAKVVKIRLTAMVVSEVIL
jgi:hypothetical protein